MGRRRVEKNKKDAEGKMFFGWESEDDRLLRFMKIPPKKKLEWLREMHEFLARRTSRKQRLIREKLRRER